MKKVTAVEKLVDVKQLMHVNSIKTANVLLESGNWILVNSYNNTAFTTKRPIYTLGKIK